MGAGAGNEKKEKAQCNHGESVRKKIGDCCCCGWLVLRVLVSLFLFRCARGKKEGRFPRLARIAFWGCGLRAAGGLQATGLLAAGYRRATGYSATGYRLQAGYRLQGLVATGYSGHSYH